MRGSKDNRSEGVELRAAQERITELEARLAEAASRDPVVPGLLSLGAFMSQLEVDVMRGHRYRRTVSVAILDVDGFRQLNLEHGYATGDEVLTTVGAAIAAGVRGSDLACRAGGDEFAILFCETGADQAAAAMVRVIESLADLDEGPVHSLSASAGIAQLERGESPEMLLARARRTLDAAKAAGGGRAMLTPDHAPQAAVSNNGS